jgi:two-component sensor histidine kinase
MVWAGALTAFQESPYTFVICAFLLAVVHLTSLFRSVVIYGSGFLALAISNVFVHGTPLGTNGVVFIELGAAVVFAALVSMLLSRATRNGIAAEERLQETLEAQEHEIQRRTAELQEVNERLLERVGEREVLLREIHHRVKNNLQILGSILRLTADNADRHDALRLLQSAEQRVYSMAMVHQQLYDTDHLEAVDLHDYLHALCSYVVDSYEDHGIAPVNCGIEACRVGIDLAVNIGLILTEGLSNAFSHAFSPDQSDRRVSVSLRCTADELHLEIRDNGRGFSPETAGSSESMGLGLSLIENLVSQLHGKLEYRVESGTAVQCTIPYFPPR